MHEELMFEIVKDRQARVRNDFAALKRQRADDHPILRRLGALMIRAGERLQSLGREELTREPASGAA